MIKLGIISGNLKPSNTGIGTYTFELIENIRERTSVTLIRHPSGDDVPGCSSIISSFPPGSFSHVIWSQALSLKKKSLKDFDIIHNTAQYPVSPKIHSHYIITIHDLIPVLYPQYVGKIYSLQAKIHYPMAIRSASKIITVSKHTKNDIIRLYNIPESKIEVIYECFSDKFIPASTDDKNRVRAKYNLNNPYILFVGAIEPKKNIELLIRAFYLCQKENMNFQLVIVGKRAWKFESIFNLVDKLKLHHKIKFLNFVPYEDLPALYSAAEVFVFPSRYEGFGLPPLEAMKCGTPVITSNMSSLPEIVGKNGLMVNPDDEKQLAKSILNILSDPELQKKFSTYSLKRAELFSWKKTGKETINVYNSVLEAGV